MEFGRLPSVEGLDLGLPREHGGNAALLARSGGGALEVRIGLAGWSDRGFVGPLYAPGTPARSFLSAHARVFTTNELNSTYYGLDAERVARWAAAVPEGFQFCPKLPGEITHELQLSGAEQAMERCIAAFGRFGDPLGRAWGVLPPGFGPDRLGVLEAFLERFAARLPLALELRHPAWFANPRAADAVFDLFERCRVTAVLCDTAGRRDVLHQRLSVPEVFLRFVGNHPSPTDERRLDAWIEQLGAWSARGLRRVDLFLHQRSDPDAVGTARYLADALGTRLGKQLLPGLDQPPSGPAGFQGELFA